jgi:predicted RNA-binding protein with PUA-like domain
MVGRVTRSKRALAPAAATARAETRPRRYWLFKSEPESYGFAQFQRDGRTAWNGVRNYQARNLLRDEIRVGDGVLFYHSSVDPNVIAGVAKVVANGYPDPMQFEPGSDYHDPDSDPDDPRWFVVDIACVGPMRTPVTRDQCKREPALAGMMLLQRGSRLSVQPVTPREWQTILALGGQHESW